MAETISEVRAKAQRARDVAPALSVLSAECRNGALRAMAQGLRDNADRIIAENAEDVRVGRENGMPEPLIDRLMLDDKRIAGMADALCALADMDDPLGIVLEQRTIDAGIELSKVTAPLGVVAMIYEARPNVTADAAGLCLKTGNASILRGGSSAVRSNRVLTDVLSVAAEGAGVPAGAIQLIDDMAREATDELMGMTGLVDVLIPRGGAGLIQHCVQHSKVPVIETGVGNCHVYLHKSADKDLAVSITVNAKTNRPGVCNAAESLLVDACAADELLPPVLVALAEKGVVLHCDEKALDLARGADITTAVAATEDDWGREYLDMEMSVRCVAGVEEACELIGKYGTKHSECIVATDRDAVDYFFAHVDAAAIYHNASTRFTDGGCFGLGAEIGISTQKLHVRGPMGLSALCSYKYLLEGTGQVR